MPMVEVDIAKMQQLAKDMQRAIPRGTTRAEVEFAALFLYTMVAEGVAQYPADSRFERGLLVLRDGGDALIASMARVRVLTDDDVRMELEAKGAKGSTN